VEGHEIQEPTIDLVASFFRSSFLFLLPFFPCAPASSSAAPASTSASSAPASASASSAPASSLTSSSASAFAP
jgi:hypothetical protein